MLYYTCREQEGAHSLPPKTKEGIGYYMLNLSQLQLKQFEKFELLLTKKIKKWKIVIQFSILPNGDIPVSIWGEISTKNPQDITPTTYHFTSDNYVTQNENRFLLRSRGRDLKEVPKYVQKEALKVIENVTGTNNVQFDLD